MLLRHQGFHLWFKILLVLKSLLLGFRRGFKQRDNVLPLLHHIILRAIRWLAKTGLVARRRHYFGYNHHNLIPLSRLALIQLFADLVRLLRAVVCDADCLHDVKY